MEPNSDNWAGEFDKAMAELDGLPFVDSGVDHSQPGVKVNVEEMMKMVDGLEGLVCSCGSKFVYLHHWMRYKCHDCGRLWK